MSDAPRLLLVDDEAAVTRLLAKYLERLGYVIDVSLSAEDGLARFDENPDGWDLVLSDLSLPGMQGDAMLRQMLAKRPSLSAIVSSGYPFSLEAFPGTAPKQIAFLQKPYLPSMLADMLAKMLKKPKSASA